MAGAPGSEPDARELRVVTPVVLVGGRSRRFGRDKLCEPVADGSGSGGEVRRAGGRGWLVDRPIAALRDVFGPRVAAVGVCDPRVAARFDRVIEDAHPGAGPIGGIISALGAADGPVLVLAGDLVAVTADEVRAMLREWARADEGREAPLAVMAMTDRPEPCCALYMPGALPLLRERLARGQRSLHDALPAGRVALALMARERLANINSPEDLRSA